MDAKSMELSADKITAFCACLPKLQTARHHIILKLHKHSWRAALQLLVTLYPH